MTLLRKLVQTKMSLDLMVSKSPVGLLGLPPVVETEHDGEGAGGQQLLVVVVVEAVSCRQSKSISNLRKKNPSSMHLQVSCKSMC